MRHLCRIHPAPGAGNDRGMTRTVIRSLPFAGGAALVAAGALPWLTHRTNPLADDSDNLGQTLLLLGSTGANLWCALVGIVLIGAGVAVLGRPGTDPRAARRTAIVGAVLGLLTLDHTLLMVIGYLPMAIGLAAVGHADELDILLSPGLLVQAFVGGAALALSAWLLRDWRPRPEADPDPLAAATRRTRRWTLLAIEAPLVYALSRVLMFLHVPGFDAVDGVVLWAGLGLAAASIGGACLTWGLVRPWGERFPRWMLGLAGRRVPIGLAVVPALVVAAFVATSSRAILVGLATADADERHELLSFPLIWLPQLLWPLWAAALALAALHYRERRHLSDARANAGTARFVDDHRDAT